MFFEKQLELPRIAFNEMLNVRFYISTVDTMLLVIISQRVGLGRAHCGHQRGPRLHVSAG
jgi:hypothetical protein